MLYARGKGECPSASLPLVLELAALRWSRREVRSLEGGGGGARKQGCPSGDAQVYIKAWGWSVPSRVDSRGSGLVVGRRPLQ